MNIENTPTPEALSTLTEKQRQAYLLRKEGLTYTAIAKRMGNTVTAARQSCHGANGVWRSMSNISPPRNETMKSSISPLRRESFA